MRLATVSLHIGVAFSLGGAPACSSESVRTHFECSEQDRCGGSSNCYAVCMCVERNEESCSTMCPEDVPPALFPPDEPEETARQEEAALLLVNSTRHAGGCCEEQGCFGAAAPRHFERAPRHFERCFSVPAGLGRRVN